MNGILESGTTPITQAKTTPHHFCIILITLMSYVTLSLFSADCVLLQ